MITKGIDAIISIKDDNIYENKVVLLMTYTLEIRLNTKGYDEYLEKRFKIAHKLKNKVIEYFNRQEHRRRSSGEYQILANNQKEVEALKDLILETKDKATKLQLKEQLATLENNQKDGWIALNNSFNLSSSKFVKYKELGQASNMYQNYADQGLVNWSTFENIATTVKAAYLKRKQQTDSSNFLSFQKYRDFNTMWYRKLNQDVTFDGIYLGKRGHKIFLPYKFRNDQEVQLAYAMERQKLALFAIKRVMNAQGNWKYSVLLVFDGIPYNHAKIIQEGRVDIRLEVPYVKVYKDGELVLQYDLNNDNGLSKRLSDFDRQIEHLRRIHNKDNYNEDGTIKKGKHKWNYSKNYYKLLNKRNHLWHKSIGYRKVKFGTIANEVLALGNEFYIFDQDFKKLQMRKTVAERDFYYENSKRQGKEILFNAPSQLKLALQQKLAYLDKELHIIKE